MIVIHVTGPFQIGADERPWATCRTKPLCRHWTSFLRGAARVVGTLQASVAPPRRALSLRLRTHLDVQSISGPPPAATPVPLAWDREDRRRPGSTGGPSRRVR